MSASTSMYWPYCVFIRNLHTPSTFDTAPVNPSTQSTGGSTSCRSPSSFHASPATLYWAPVSSLIRSSLPLILTLAVGSDSTV
ncbi:hypothetical protein PF001_g28118 [Phytophthora fragariae]|uniref:Uncharacterized protein n=1 Tax=Phytophthora fragariae TaxID=53985 RepID=A0A6A4BCW4_9STRA|nr:hypothetical protein PF001_g28118 [Phytophthora fragariae]